MTTEEIYEFPVQLSLIEYIEIDKRVDVGESMGLEARWEFGRGLLAERIANGGNQLPHGRLETICVATGKSRAEIKNRVQFAEEYPTPEEVANALATYGSWLGICSEGLGNRAVDDDEDGDEWYTPRWLFDGLGLTFDLDVCAPADLTHVSTPAKRFITEDTGGLWADWKGLVWCNPPYSDTAPWASRMVDHHNGLLLSHIPMNAEWATEVWHACDGLRLFQAMEFVRPDGTPQRPGYWLALASFGEEATAGLARLAADDEPNPRRPPFADVGEGVTIAEQINASNERFERLAWPVVSEWMSWTGYQRASLEDDYAGIDYYCWNDGFPPNYIPIQTRMQTGYVYPTFTLRQSEAVRLRDWSIAPFPAPPMPTYWVQGYGDPLVHLYLTTTHAIWHAVYNERFRWQQLHDESKWFAVIEVEDLVWSRQI